MILNTGLKKFSTVVGLLASLFAPVFSVEVVPAWAIRITDVSDRPVSNEVVVQTWSNDSLEFWRMSEHVDQKITDSNGEVSFPARRIRYSVGSYVFSLLRDSLASFTFHSDFGGRSTIYCPKYLGCSATYKEGQELQRSLRIPE